MSIAFLHATISANKHWRKVDLVDRSSYLMALAFTHGAARGYI